MPETATQQLMMSNLAMNSQIMQGTLGVISSIGNLQKSDSNNDKGIANLTVTNSLGKLAYAVEGDSKYKEELDSNNDGIITFNEYVKHITEQVSSKSNIPKTSTTFSFAEDAKTGLYKFSVTNMGKILSLYMNNSVQLPTGLIEQEA